ncbi:hypothetical protein F8388_007503, partial [Cannabis sativa]
MESPFRADVVKDKVALITGGASGIGVEISTQFGKHGASIVIMGRRKHVIDSAISALRSLGISAALDAITRNLALEWGTDYDMKVNGIAPGPIADTPKMNELIPKQEMETKTSDYLPVTKFGETWDVAMAALYLVSDAGKHINGANMVVDGGLWLSRPPHLPKEFVKQLSRAVEKKKS